MAGAGEPRALGRNYVETDAAERLIVMADEMEECGDSAKHESVLGRVLVLLARRLCG